MHFVVFCLFCFKLLIFLSVYFCEFLHSVLFAEKLQMEISSGNKGKQGYLKHTWPEKAFKGTVVNRALPFLHGGSLLITRTIPLSALNWITWIEILSSRNVLSSLPDSRLMSFCTLLDIQSWRIEYIERN